MIDGRKGIIVMSKKKETDDGKKKITIGTVIIIGLLAILGITLAWFYQHQKVASITKIAPPGKTIISGVHGRKLDQIDLSYNSGDVNGNTVTVRNVICVDSASEEIYLKLAHTTNVKDLSLCLYPATESTTEPTGPMYIKGSDAGTDYYYRYDSQTGWTTRKTTDSNNMKQMTCLNKDSDNSELAKKDTNDIYYKSTYGTETNVQKQAVPLYWKSDVSYKLPLNSKQDKNNHIKYEHYGYFVLEASWTEQEKETDIVYVVADTTAEETGQGK